MEDRLSMPSSGGSPYKKNKSLKRLLARYFKPLIKESNVYNVSYIQIKKANRMYKPVDNDIMIGFTKWILCCLDKSVV